MHKSFRAAGQGDKSPLSALNHLTTPSTGSADCERMPSDSLFDFRGDDRLLSVGRQNRRALAHDGSLCSGPFIGRSKKYYGYLVSRLICRSALSCSPACWRPDDVAQNLRGGGHSASSQPGRKPTYYRKGQ